jgi:hypothetical protein
MENTWYQIEYRQCEWIVSVGRAPVLICKHKRPATKTVSVATHLLLVEASLSPGRFPDTSALHIDGRRSTLSTPHPPRVQQGETDLRHMGGVRLGF